MNPPNVVINVGKLNEPFGRPLILTASAGGDVFTYVANLQAFDIDAVLVVKVSPADSE